MKATIDLPAELYRRVKAKSALEGRPVRDVAAELFDAYVRGAVALERPDATARPADELERPDWFGIARRLGARTADPDLATERASVERGWAAEVERRERRLAKRSRR